MPGIDNWGASALFEKFGPESIWSKVIGSNLENWTNFCLMDSYQTSKLKEIWTHVETKKILQKLIIKVNSNFENWTKRLLR